MSIDQVVLSYEIDVHFCLDLLFEIVQPLSGGLFLDLQSNSLLAAEFRIGV
jgi:hypothetical protein